MTTRHIVTTVTFPCPICSERCEQDVDCDGNPVGSPVTDGCVSAACQEAYFRGEYDAALDAAWEEWVEAAQERAAGNDRNGDANLLHIQREAQRLK